MEITQEQAISELSTIPGIGRSLAGDLWNINIRSVSELKGKDPEQLYALSNAFAGTTQDRCVLYAFRVPSIMPALRKTCATRKS